MMASSFRAKEDLGAKEYESFGGTVAKEHHVRRMNTMQVFLLAKPPLGRIPLSCPNLTAMEKRVYDIVNCGVLLQGVD